MTTTNSKTINLLELTFAVRGLHCASCVNRLEKKLLENRAISTAIVNLATESGFVKFDPTMIEESGIFALVTEAGYTPLAQEQAEEAGLFEEKQERFWLYISLGASIPIMLTMGQHSNHAVMQFNLLLATAVQFTAGLTFYRGAWTALLNRTATMDVLVALGTSAAYFYSLAAYFGMLGSTQDMFFETSVMLIAFIRLGKYLEARARGKAGAALKQLLHLQPDKAHLLRETGEEEVPTAIVRIGDILVVRPGESIPVDGVVISGSAAVDESMINGESMPVLKNPGDSITGATINKNGVLQLRATAIGQETVLAQIIAMVRAAQGDKPPIQRFADSVSAWFVPLVLLISMATFAIWKYQIQSDFITAFTFAITVIVIACPCAMGLATPTAIMVGSGVALRRGILVKKASALEAIAGVQIAMFDKTGTLTNGTPVMTELIPVARSIDPNRLLKCLATAEAYSTHPLADAVKKTASDAMIEVDQASDYEERGGFGITCIYNGCQLAVGNQRLMSECGVKLEPLIEKIAPLTTAGKSLLFIAVDGHLVGLAAFADTLKPSAAVTISTLKKLGITSRIVSGDQSDVVARIALQAGIENFDAEILPGRKQELVKEFQAKGLCVAMIGDGINDAPALAQADVGIAIGAGTDIAKETGDIVLMRDSLDDVIRVIAIGRATLSKVKQNLFWALFYNILGIPLAAGVFSTHGITLKPEYAGLAMAFSSVSVVLNSLMLKRLEKQ